MVDDGSENGVIGIVTRQQHRVKWRDANTNAGKNQ
jgi:hypothetical protein